MTDPTTRLFNLINEQLTRHSELIISVLSWSEELTDVLEQQYEDITDAIHVAAALIEDQERRISALEAKVKELSSDG